jgi:two-component system sensor histidine kinase/response regulator
VHGLRVVAVDDNSTHRAILEEMFSGWRMKPAVFATATEALAELRRAAAAGDPYDLLLADAVMPAPDGFTLAEQVRGEPGLVRATILMLSSTSIAPGASAQPGGTWSSERSALGASRRGAPISQIGVQATVMKPLKQSELLDTILSVMSAEPGRPSRTEAAAVGPAEEELPRLPPLRVLLAEDNVVNQRLAVRILEKAGHTVFVAGNGRQALLALERERFDLVLMDLQMPELGGMEATEVIRSRESASGVHIPIIALTAHAMKGDRERCLAAGMDGYVAKPIRERELFGAMAQVVHAPQDDKVTRWQGDKVTEQSGGASVTLSPGHPVTLSSAPPRVPDFDRAAALGRCGDDAQLLRELIDIFLGEIPGWMAGLAAALESGNADQVQRLAHTIKGGVSTFAAAGAYEAALRLEGIGKSGNLAAAGPAWQEMQTAIERLQKALAAFSPTS